MFMYAYTLPPLSSILSAITNMELGVFLALV